ncbi:MAG: cobalamin-independent methionine synthase II family protein [Dehalococcoidia bacterium]
MIKAAPFSTFVVGSLPRPQWVRDLIEDRKAGRISDADAETLLDDAVPSAIRMQERAGLDYVSDGEWRRESYVKVFADAVDGFESDLLAGGGSRFSTLPYPAVTTALKPNRPIATDEARFLKSRSASKNIVAVPSPYTIARRMWDPHHSTGAYATRDEFMDACIPIVRGEVRALIALSVEAIQLDDPWLALLVDPSYREREGIKDVDHEIEMSVRSVNEVTEGLDDAFISVHLCHAHFDRRHSTRGSYELIIEALGHMNVDRFAIELATPDSGGLDALKNFPTDKILGLGAIDHTDQNVEIPEIVIQRVENALQYVPAERITLNPDCGFAPSSANPMDLDESYLKLTAMCQAAQILKDRFS